MSGVRGVTIRACDAGLANPGPVAAALWTDPELEAGVQLDGIVAVADARHLPRQLAAHPATHDDGGRAPGGASSGPGPNEAQQQLAYADVVLLNKACTPRPATATARGRAVTFSHAVNAASEGSRHFAGSRSVAWMMTETLASTAHILNSMASCRRTLAGMSAAWHSLRGDCPKRGTFHIQRKHRKQQDDIDRTLRDCLAA